MGWNGPKVLHTDAHWVSLLWAPPQTCLLLVALNNHKMRERSWQHRLLNTANNNSVGNYLFRIGVHLQIFGQGLNDMGMRTGREVKASQPYISLLGHCE